MIFYEVDADADQSSYELPYELFLTGDFQLAYLCVLVMKFLENDRVNLKEILKQQISMVLYGL